MPRPALAIEPTFLAFDSAELNGAAEVEARIDALLQASKILHCRGALNVVLPEDTATVLAHAGSYPIFAELENLLNSSGLNQTYSAQDVLRIFNHLVERAGSLEDYIGIRYALYGADLIILPDYTDMFSAHSLQTLFVEEMGKMAAAMSVNNQINSCISVFSPLAKKSDNAQVSGELVAVDPDIDGFTSNNITVCVPLSNSQRSMLLSFDGYDVWKSAEDSDCLAFALLSGVLAFGIKNGKFAKIEEIPEFSIGSEFFGSLVRNQGIGGGQFCHLVYEHTIAVICNSSGDRMIDRARADGAVAMRTHLTKHHEGLRLMYWAKNGSIELANIGPKFELKIADGDAQPTQLPTWMAS